MAKGFPKVRGGLHQVTAAVNTVLNSIRALVLMSVMTSTPFIPFGFATFAMLSLDGQLKHLNMAYQTNTQPSCFNVISTMTHCLVMEIAVANALKMAFSNVNVIDMPAL